MKKIDVNVWDEAMWEHEQETCLLNVRDTVSAVVVCSCGKGVFLKLFTGEDAFAYFGPLQPGTNVLCTVKRQARADQKILVSIDSVICSVTAA